MPRRSSELPRAVIACVILGIGLVSGGMLMQSGHAREAAAAPATAHLLDEVMSRVQSDFVDTLTHSDLQERAAVGLVAELEDPYSALLTPDRYQRVREMTSGHYAGLGLELDQRDGAVTVIAPLAGSPAESAGIRPGDRLLTIDGHPVVGLTMDEVERRLRGAKGTTVKLGLERAGSLDHLDFTLTRRDIQVHAVQRSELLPDSVGYVRFAAFNEHAATELSSAVEALRKTGMRALILDLRRNPGGLLDEGVAVSDLFLDAHETIVTTRGRLLEDDQEYTDQSAQRWPTLPIVTLTDSGTASAAEIVAGALQDHHRAVLLGSPTYGKGSAQSVFPVNDGMALKLTTARWFTPDGRSIQRDSTTGGITPDVVVRDTMSFTPATDPLVHQAEELLRGVRTLSDLSARMQRRPAQPRSPND